MNAANAQEALYIACEMEKRAIRLYERALLLFGEGPCQAAIGAILRDEKKHLNRFAQMGAETEGFERASLLSAQAARVLFPGGLVEAQRKGAFSSPASLYAYAAEEEKEAVRQYGAFAATLSGSAAAAFSAIALEETQHLKKLNDLLSQEKLEKETDEP